MEVSASPNNNQESSVLLLAAVEVMKDENLDTQTVSQHSTDLKSETSLALPKLRSKIGNGSGTKNKKMKKPTTLPNETVEYLKAWMMSPEHIAHPYPTEIEKAKIMQDTGLELKQLTNWFVNNRKRYWKPRVEANLLKDVTPVVSSTAPLPASNGVPPLVSPRPEGSNTKLLMFEKNTDTTSTRTSKRKTTKAKSHMIESTMTEASVVGTPNSLLNSKGVHFVSGQNSVASISDGTTSCSDSDEERCVVKSTALPRTSESTIYETVDVHILRPSSSDAISDVSDVSILSNIPSERILKSYSNCSLVYKSNMESNSKSNLPRRDAEIFRLKKHYLSLFLEERNGSYFDNITESNDCFSLLPTTPEEYKKRKHEVHIIPSSINVDSEIISMASYTVSPRPKYRRQSIDVWKEACQTANNVYDNELPSLEEATRLFGYAN
jgi:hypothetical protein